MFSRRHILKVSAAAPVVLSLPAWASSPDMTPLKTLAAKQGLRFGSAVSFRNSVQQPEVAAIIERECAVVVPENELKMYVTHNAGPETYNFEPADAIMAWSKPRNIAMRGHNFFWARDEYTPNWLKSYDFGSKPAVAAETLLRAYIAKVADHYGDSITSWDVVNETVDPKTGAVRDNVFGRILGMDTLRISYEAAREHLPKAQLVYNDYMCWEQDGGTHRKGVIDLLNWFRKNKISVDALGLQSHLGTDHDVSTASEREWKAFLDESTALGFDLLITEFDVNDKDIKGSIAERDDKVAKTAKAYLDLTLSYKQVKDILCWGMEDRYSWLQGFSKRQDGQRLRPAPYDENFKPKPLRNAIASAIAAAPKR